MSEVISTLVVGSIGITCWFLTVLWVTYWPGTQLDLWMYVCDLWHPSAWPLILSAWYWVLPVASSCLWAVCALYQLIAGLPQPKWWFALNLLLWMPVWLYPAVTIMLGTLGLIGIVGMWVPHKKKN